MKRSATSPSTPSQERKSRARSTRLPSDPAWEIALKTVHSYLSAHALEPTPVQTAALELLPTAGDALLIAPTGSGKTLAALLPLMARQQQRGPEERLGVGILYVAPVRALVAQQTKVLESQAEALTQLHPEKPLRVASRTGDSTSSERAKLKKQPPDVLVVTPESLSVLLGGDARFLLSQVHEVVLDETHQLARGKRGALLSVALEVLGYVTAVAGSNRARRTGLSATAKPIDGIARWLSGAETVARVFVAPSERTTQVQLCAPEFDAAFPSPQWTSRKLLPALARTIASCERTSLVFVSSRPRAERWTQALREVLPARMPVECFHGSLSAEERQRVRLLLDQGALRAVLATSSLEAGIDVAHAEQVLLLGAPASITQLVQSAGRAGHRPGQRSAAVVLPTNALELVGVLAASRCASRGELEPLVPREGDLDVLVQSVLAFCAAGPITTTALLARLRRCAPFAELLEETLLEVLEHLATGGGVFDAYEAARRIVHGEEGWELSGPASRRAYVRGVGAIMEEPAVVVQYGGRTIGRLEGRFAAALEEGDRFVLAGTTWKVLSRTPERIDATKDDHRGVIAQWTGSREARSELIARECEALWTALDAAVPDAAAVDPDALELALSQVRPLVRTPEASPESEPTNVAALVSLLLAQRRIAAVPTKDRFVIELYRRKEQLSILAHSAAGSSANEAIARAAGNRWRRATGAGAEIAASDTGFLLSVRLLKRAPMPDEEFLRTLFAPEQLEDELAATLDGSFLARTHFREVARISQLLLETGRPGTATPGLLYDVLRKHSTDHLLLRALEQTLWSALDGPRAASWLQSIRSRRWVLCAVRQPSPLALPLLLRESSGHERIAPEDLEDALAAEAWRLFQSLGSDRVAPESVLP